MRIAQEKEALLSQMYFTAKDEWGCKPETASALRYLLQCAMGYKIDRRVKQRWQEAGFIEDDKAALDEDMLKGDGTAWVCAACCYEGLLERVEP